MSKLPDNILEMECHIDNASDENEVEEMEAISNELYSILQSHPGRFNSWETRFVEDIFYLDKAGLTKKQQDCLYKLDRKFIQGER